MSFWGLPEGQPSAPASADPCQSLPAPSSCLDPKVLPCLASLCHPSPPWAPAPPAILWPQACADVRASLPLGDCPPRALKGSFCRRPGLVGDGAGVSSWVRSQVPEDPFHQDTWPLWGQITEPAASDTQVSVPIHLSLDSLPQGRGASAQGALTPCKLEGTAEPGHLRAAAAARQGGRRGHCARRATALQKHGGSGPGEPATHRGRVSVAEWPCCACGHGDDVCICPASLGLWVPCPSDCCSVVGCDAFLGFCDGDRGRKRGQT